jgi:8-oxo-dGTP diphosphatase
MKKVEVVAAVILNNSQILSVQRPKHRLDYISEKFEFPGGKIERGETRKEALERELKEELSLIVNVGNHLITVKHQYPDFELTMHTYFVKIEKREIKLNEHIAQVWLGRSELNSVEWAAADIPIVNKLKSMEWEIF